MRCSIQFRRPRSEAGPCESGADEGLVGSDICRFSRIELVELFLVREQLPEVLVAHHQVTVLNRCIEGIQTTRCRSRDARSIGGESASVTRTEELLLLSVPGYFAAEVRTNGRENLELPLSVLHHIHRFLGNRLTPPVTLRNADHLLERGRKAREGIDRPQVRQRSVGGPCKQRIQRETNEGNGQQGPDSSRTDADQYPYKGAPRGENSLLRFFRNSFGAGFRFHAVPSTLQPNPRS